MLQYQLSADEATGSPRIVMVRSVPIWHACLQDLQRHGNNAQEMSILWRPRPPALSLATWMDRSSEFYFVVAIHPATVIRGWPTVMDKRTGSANIKRCQRIPARELWFESRGG